MKTDREFFKRVWKLAYPYWISDEWKVAWSLSILILASIVLYVYMSFRVNYWSNDFFNTFTTLNAGEFYRLLGVFGILVSIIIPTFIAKSYLLQVLEIRWRRWMTDKFVKKWLDNQAYYGLQLQGFGTDNPDQRIQQDVSSFTAQTTGLILGIFRHFLMLFTFLGVLWSLSGDLSFKLLGWDINIPGYMFFAALFISIFGTFISYNIGKPLIGLNFQQEKREADYRYSLMRLRENVESVALFSGEAHEAQVFNNRFDKILENYYAIIRRFLGINFWLSAYGQANVIIPALLAAPKVFAGVISFGGFMQIRGAYDYVHSALSFIVDNYPAIASWQATTQRLLTFQEQIDTLNSKSSKWGIKIIQSDSASIRLEDVDIFLPDGTLLLENMNFEFRPHEHTLITGPSGIGKSTIFRTIAGIWPYASGVINLPRQESLMFLPQRPYMPLGKLRDIITYPEHNGTSDERLIEILNLLELPDLCHRLDDVDDWSRVLSLGEQQKIGTARAILKSPDWLFLDEATSAIDEKAESYLYRIIFKELPQTTLISVGHRVSLHAFHHNIIQLGSQIAEAEEEDFS